MREPRAAAPALPAPLPKPAPLPRPQVVTASVNGNSSNAYWSSASAQVQLMVARPPRRSPQDVLQSVRHPDVFLPLVAALIVLLLLLAWAP